MADQGGVAIIGAGIAGLSIAAQLSRSGIPCSIYEARSEDGIGHGYGVTLYKSGYKKILKHVTSKENQTAALRKAVAVDRLVGGTGRVSKDSKADSSIFQATDSTLRQFLVNSIDTKHGSIHWKHSLTAIEPQAGNKGATLKFDNGQTATAEVVIDAGGLRSPAFDQVVSDAPKPKLLPYVSYYGTRRISLEDFDRDYAHYFGSGNTITFPPLATGDAFIEIKKVHQPLKDAAPATSDTTPDHRVELRYLYSRPPESDTEDPLWRPNRAPQEAKNIPNEFYDEFLSYIASHQRSQGQIAMLKAFFNHDKLHTDRLLNWHLRLRLPPFSYFASTAEAHKGYEMIAVGDAAHGLPIVESRGAVLAMTEADQVAHWLITRKQRNDSPSASWYQGPGKHVYQNALEEAAAQLQRLRKVHAQPPLSHEELEELLGSSVSKPSQSSSASSGEESSEEGHSREKL